MSARLSISTLSLVVLVLAFAAPALAAEPAQTPVTETPGTADAGAPALFDEELFTPAPTPMAPPCSSCVGGFTSSPGGGAASHWGFGSDCTAATTDLRSQLSAYANDVCFVEGDYGRCAFSVVYTSSCFYNPSYGLFQIDGYTNFSCWISWC